MQDTMTITRSMFDAFNKRDFNQIVSLTSDRFDWIDLPTGMKFTGKDGLNQWCHLWANAFSDAKVEIVNHFVSGEFVCTEYIGRGKHTGQLVLGSQKIPPSNRSVEFHLCNVTRVQDGKIIGGQVYYDLLTMMRQLGMEQAKLAA